MGKVCREARAALEVHLQLVDGFTAIECPRDEGALDNALFVPRERYHHPGVAMPDANLLPVEVHPQRPSTGPKPESPNHGRLRLCHEVRGREELADQVSCLLVLADDLDVLVEKQRTPFLANTHGRVNGPPMHLINASETIFVPIVVEIPASPHPVAPRPNPGPHVIQREHDPSPRRYSLTCSGTQYSSMEFKLMRRPPSAVVIIVMKLHHRHNLARALKCREGHWRRGLMATYEMKFMFDWPSGTCV